MDIAVPIMYNIYRRKVKQLQIKDKIKYLRKRNDFTQTDLANKLDVAKTTVSTWERGGNLPLMDKIVQMADIFNVPISYFFDDVTEDI